MLGMFVQNFEMKTFNALVIRATSLLLEDIAGYTGATIISNATGVNFQNFRRHHLGFAKKVESDAHKTLFIGNGESHKQYAKELEAKADGEPNMYTQENMKKRVAKITGGIAVLRIGAPTDYEREYKKTKGGGCCPSSQRCPRRRGDRRGWYDSLAYRSSNGTKNCG